jgi:hypothetical protein
MEPREFAAERFLKKTDGGVRNFSGGKHESPKDVPEPLNQHYIMSCGKFIHGIRDVISHFRSGNTGRCTNVKG